MNCPPATFLATSLAATSWRRKGSGHELSASDFLATSLAAKMRLLSAARRARRQARRGEAAAPLSVSMRNTAVRISEWTACVVLSSVVTVLGVAGPYGQSPGSNAATHVRVGLERLALGSGDWNAFSVTYDDLHGLHGGMLLTVFGTGRVEQKAVRTQVRDTRRVSAQDLQGLVTLLRELQAWEQRTPERAPAPDESRSRLTIRVDGAETTIWEWYNEMPKNARIARVRDRMTEYAWVPTGAVREAERR